MRIIWKYLRPFKGWLMLAIVLAAIAHVLQLIDPVIFGKIIDQYAKIPGTRSEDQLIAGAEITCIGNRNCDLIKNGTGFY